MDHIMRRRRAVWYVRLVSVVALLGGLLGLVATPSVATPSVAAPASPSNASSLPEPKHLLGFDPDQPLPADYTPPTFEFPSADDVLQLPAPPDPKKFPAESEIFQEYLDSLGAPETYTAGSPAHFYARWKAYQLGGGKSSFERYRARYVNMTNNRHTGWEFEPFLRGRESLFSGSGWQFGQQVAGTGVGQKPDMYADTEVDAFEIKAGATLRKSQLDGFVTIAKLKGKVFQFLFRELPSSKALKAIDEVNRALPENANLKPGEPLKRVIVIARYYPAIPVPVSIPEDQHAPARPTWEPPQPSAPPSASGGAPKAPGGNPVNGPSGGGAGAAVPGALAAPGQHAVAGGLSTAIANSPDSPADAAENAELDRQILAEYANEPAKTSDPDDIMPEDLGGVDFSTLQLRYVSDTYRGQAAQFAFKVDATPEDQPSYGGKRAAQLASDSFFVWLELPTNAFTVNLNPDEPDRIIDDRFGLTDAGRVLLEADLQMKKSVAQFIDPDTPLGRQYWDALRGEGKCISLRQWIVPGTATVHETENELSILDAPLTVKMETEYFTTQRTGGIGASCGKDKAAAEFNEQLYRTMILPLVEKAVNEAPEYADLRRVYFSRVAAQWYRERSAKKHTAYSDLIDKGDITRWVSQEPWSPREVYDRYVKSFKEGEFNRTYSTTVGNVIHTWTYVYGGVDFTSIARNGLDSAAFASQRPTLPQTVAKSLYGAVSEQDGREVWLGGMTSNRPLKELLVAGPTPPTSSMVFYALTGAPVLAWLAAGVWLLRRRRRRRGGTVEPAFPVTSP
jgi:hypothetical protein